jgi:hypothetical protein
MTVSISNTPILGGGVLSSSGASWSEPKFPGRDEFMGRFEIYKIQNGYLLRYSWAEGELWKSTYVGAPDKIGETMTAILVERKMENERNSK